MSFKIRPAWPLYFLELERRNSFFKLKPPGRKSHRGQDQSCPHLEPLRESYSESCSGGGGVVAQGQGSSRDQGVRRQPLRGSCPSDGPCTPTVLTVLAVGPHPAFPFPDRFSCQGKLIPVLALTGGLYTLFGRPGTSLVLCTAFRSQFLNIRVQHQDKDGRWEACFVPASRTKAYTEEQLHLTLPHFSDSLEHPRSVSGPECASCRRVFSAYATNEPVYQLPCGHLLCRPCLSEKQRSQPMVCTACQQPVTSQDVLRVHF